MDAVLRHEQPDAGVPRPRSVSRRAQLRLRDLRLGPSGHGVLHRGTHPIHPLDGGEVPDRRPLVRLVHGADLPEPPVHDGGHGARPDLERPLDDGAADQRDHPPGDVRAQHQLEELLREPAEHVDLAGPRQRRHLLRPSQKHLELFRRCQERDAPKREHCRSELRSGFGRECRGRPAPRCLPPEGRHRGSEGKELGSHPAAVHL